MLYGKQIKNESINLSKINPNSAQTLTLAAGSKIQVTDAPIDGLDLVNKAYVDSVATGLDVKASVKASTTVSITLLGEQVIDGVSVLAGDRVLVKDQASGIENGIYIVGGAMAPAWVRSEDANNNAEVTPGLFTFVEEGTTLADTGWVLSINGIISLGTTALVFTQFSAAGLTTASNGLTKTNNNIKLGGSLTENTIINGNANNLSLTAIVDYNLSANNIQNTTSFGINNTAASNIANNAGASIINSAATWISNSADVGIQTNTGNNSFIMRSSATSVTNNGANNNIVVTDAISSKGIVYAADYSTNFTLESLVSKRYVDSVSSKLDVKASVKHATTQHLSSLSGEQIIDGQWAYEGFRILVKNQNQAGTNGIYVISLGAWSRAEDANTSAKLNAGAFTFVEEGTTLADTGWILTTNDPVQIGEVILGNNNLFFVQFSSAGVIIAGAGLTKSDNTLNVIAANTSILVLNDSIKAAVPQTSNKQMTASVTTIDFQIATVTTLVSTPAAGSYIQVLVNGVSATLGFNKTKDCYFSADLGVTPKLFSAIVAGDSLYWVGSVAEFQLAITDEIDFNYVTT